MNARPASVWRFLFQCGLRVITGRRRTPMAHYCGMVSTAVLTLIGKPGCHLCDAAREVIDSVVLELATHESAPSIVVREVSIYDDPDLLDKYVEEIPVLLLNGRVHNIWRVDAVRLRSALLEV
jgi:glutaredoxin